jgi:hypothetical protein
VRWASARAGIQLLRGVLPSPRATPVTFGYLLVLLASTVLLRVLGRDTAHVLLAASSTDVAHLGRRPLLVLVGSALWLPDLRWASAAVAFTLALAPVERSIGGRWMLAVFASGHLLATLATELPVAWAIHQGWLAGDAAHRIDVGVSYGSAAVLSALAGLLTASSRRAVLLVAAVMVIVPLLTRPGLTPAGHAAALAIGFLWWPWLARTGRLGSVRPAQALGLLPAGLGGRLPDGRVPGGRVPCGREPGSREPGSDRGPIAAR